MNKYPLFYITLLFWISSGANVYADDPKKPVKKDTCAAATNVTPVGIKKAAEALSEATKKCFDPEKDVDIKKYMHPNRIGSSPGETCATLHETAASMKKLHQYILTESKKYGMDPRLVYIRILGESQGNPFAQYDQSSKKKCQKPSSLSVSSERAFGLFQFLGKGFGKDKSYAEELVEKMKANELKPSGKRVGVRELQIKYYFDEYVSKYSVGVSKCLTELPKNDRFKKLSNIQQLSHLGRGSCVDAEVKKSLNTINTNESYKNTGAKRLFEELDTVPVCEKK